MTNKVNANVDIKSIIFHELIGEWSETVFQCSYNDHDVLEAILEKRLDEELALDCVSPRGRELLREHYPNVDNWQQLFEDLIQHHKGWPDGWSKVHTAFKNLNSWYHELIKRTGREDLLELTPIPYWYDFEECVKIDLISSTQKMTDSWFVIMMEAMNSDNHLDIFNRLKPFISPETIKRVDELLASEMKLKVTYDKAQEILSFKLTKETHL